MPIALTSMLAALVERSQRQPDQAAYTFVDFDVDPSGYAETLTWREVHQRAEVIAAQVAAVGAPGDRVAIIAPQGLDYILGFFGAMMAGRIAVPLSVPMPGGYDERVSAALADSAPAVILTTTTVVNDVVACARAVAGIDPEVIEVDALDLATPVRFTAPAESEVALLQYTSGSTRTPAGVVVSHRNVAANGAKVLEDFFADSDGIPPANGTIVSWLPFYHDMGMLMGLVAALLGCRHAVLMSPLAFLVKPARWMQLLARHPQAFTAAPNFAFELATRRTSDADLAGLDLGDVHSIISGGERIHAATVARFTERFAAFNLPANAVAPSYGLAEAMYAGSAPRFARPAVVRFDYPALVAGETRPGPGHGGVELVSIGAPRACTVRIVDPQTRTENPAGRVGEVWLHGANVADGYWHKPDASERTFGGRIIDPTPGTPAGPWLRTGDLGVLTDGEFFIVGRIKDLLIVDGRNHYPDDIEATIQEISGGRTVAISIPDQQTERLVAIVEWKNKGGTNKEVLDKLRTVKQKVTSAISKLHGVRVADLVLVPQGAIPITTSGKVRRSTCVERYQRDEFSRLDGDTSQNKAEAFS